MILIRGKMTINYYLNDIPKDLEIAGDLAIDTESSGLHYQSRDRLCMLQFSNGDNTAHLVHFPDGNYEAPNLKALLKDEKKAMIFHFARFDVGIIKQYLGVNIQNIYCTKIASRIARTYTDQHSLKELCKEIVGINISKAQQTTDWGKHDLSKDQLKYAANDVLHLHKIRENLNVILKREKRIDVTFDIFKFLPTRVQLDIMGWNDVDIFHH